MDLTAPSGVSVRSLRVGSATYPVDLPSIRDARLHSSFVVLTIHVLGQVAFGFRVSVPQIVSAIGACAVLEILVTARRRQRVSWPASAILTGSGVGLILRIDGMRAWDHWSWRGWYLYAGTAVFSLATKYVLRLRDRQIFNPSNVGLLLVFLVLGSTRVEPLDLWWTHFDIPMVIAYAAIALGGVLITHRLALLGMAAAFWVTLGAGSAVLASSGHCITANWSTRPVCDADFTRLLLTSPEILIFTFFMLTDPKTAPLGALRRLAFGSSVGILSLLFLAPARTEFATKISLFAALAIVCVVRALGAAFGADLVRRLPHPRRFASGDVGGFAVGISLPAVAGVLALMVAQLGAPARTAFAAVESVVLPDPRSAAPGIAVDNGPRVTEVGSLVSEVDPQLADEGQRAAFSDALMLGLAVEEEAVRARNAELLVAVDHGSRLAELRSAIAANAPPSHYEFSEARLYVVRAGGQGGLVVAVEANGTVTKVGATAKTTVVFGVRRYRNDRWLIVDSWAPGEVEVIR